MKNLKFLILLTLILIISGCKDQKSKDTKLKGEFDFETKTIKKDSSNDLTTREVKDKIGELRDKNEELKMKSGELRVKSEGLKDKGDLRKSDKLIVKNKSDALKSKNQPIVNDPAKMPEKWSNAYANDPKWMELFQETSNSFLTGWANEFQRNPEARISKEELLFAYRRRMEKIFYQTPSFIEFSVNELKNSEQFNNLITDFQTNIQ
ncbi:MAG: hypothetical protein FJZ67_05150 [Bacteroidetes bacterium]|nr:hypothetical protein [Bacteroidota bacterium]